MTDLRDFVLKALCHCPTCGHEFTGALESRPGSEPPKPGDLTVCIRCANVAIFDEAMQLRAVPQEEVAPEDRESIERSQRMVRQVIERFGTSA